MNFPYEPRPRRGGVRGLLISHSRRTCASNLSIRTFATARMTSRLPASSGAGGRLAADSRWDAASRARIAGVIHASPDFLPQGNFFRSAFMRSTQLWRPATIATTARALPSSVRGPVLAPPCMRQRVFPIMTHARQRALIRTRPLGIFRMIFFVRASQRLRCISKVSERNECGIIVPHMSAWKGPASCSTEWQ